MSASLVSYGAVPYLSAMALGRDVRVRVRVRALSWGREQEELTRGRVGGWVGGWMGSVGQVFKFLARHRPEIEVALPLSACVRAFVRAFVRACVRACMCVCVCVRERERESRERERERERETERARAER